LGFGGAIEAGEKDLRREEPQQTYMNTRPMVIEE
jgi:hypothetical protein